MKLSLIICIMVSLSTLVQCVSQPVFDETGWSDLVNGTDRSLVYAPHLRPDGIFFNPWLPVSPLRPNRSWFWSRMFGKKAQFDFSPEPYAAVPNDYAYLADKNHDSISFAGHASMIIKMDNETIFTDPFFSNAALVVRKKVRLPFDFSPVPERPVVLISHNHYDHLDKYSIRQFIKKDAVFIVPLRLKTFFTRLGAREVYELDWWESISLGSDESGSITYTLLPAQHWSNRLGSKPGSTLWRSFLIQGSKTVYFSGDSGYFKGFAEFGEQYTIDYAILGVGAYEPRWFMHYAHMNVAEFFRAADDLGAAITIPMHFGIIKLSDEPLLYPLYAIDLAVKAEPEYARKIHSLRAGESLVMRTQ